MDSIIHSEKRKQIDWDALIKHNGKTYKPVNRPPKTGEPYAMWSYDRYWMMFNNYYIPTCWPTYDVEIINDIQTTQQ